MQLLLLWILGFILALIAIGSAPAKAGPPFFTDDPEPIEYQHAEVNFFTQATTSKGGTNGIAPGIDANYGLMQDVQIHATAQMAYDATHGRDDLFGGHNSAPFGLGDTELGVKYRFIRETEEDSWPQVAIYPLIELPTGNARHDLGAGYVREFIPLWLQKDLGSWQTFGGGGYWNNPGNGNQNYWFMGWVLQRRNTTNLTVGGEHFHQTASTLKGRESTGFNLGGIYSLSESYNLLFSAGKGIQNNTDTNTFSYYLSLQWEY